MSIQPVAGSDDQQTVDDDLIEFAEESVQTSDPWHVLVVDDEPGVHDVTRLVLSGFRFEGRPVLLHHAYSAGEAKQLLREHPDMAVALLDVVMESEQAGLQLVRWIREDLENPHIRLVLRTGQPGQAPEQEVIANYDINDYKDKTELTAQKLSTVMYATLRAWRDISIIEANKRGLERVIASSVHIFSQQKSHEFASAVLTQLSNLVGMEKGALYCRPRDESVPRFRVAAATGEYERYVNRDADDGLPERIVGSLREAFTMRRNLFRPDHYVLFFTDSHHSESLLYVGETWRLSPMDYKLIELFCTNVSVAFENLHLNQELFDSQLEMVHLLAGAAETRSRETANHVRRVGLLSELLARSYGLPDQDADTIRFAAPLHDIGKIGIPDAILNKPGPHTPEESQIMRTHTTLGAMLLSESRRPLLKMAATVAHEHHENWDGSGYPRGLRGTEIHVAGRIVAVADVFDALGSQRCYKAPWPEARIREFMQGQSGRKFEPRLVELLFDRWREVEDLRARYPD